MGLFAQAHRTKATRGGSPRRNPPPYKVVAKKRTLEEAIAFLRARGFVGPLSQMVGRYGQNLVCHPDRRGVLQCVQFAKVAMPEVVHVAQNPNGMLSARPTPQLCYDAHAGVVRGKGSMWDGRPVELISLLEVDPPQAVVTHPDPERQIQITIPLCPELPLETPPGGGATPGTECCIDPVTGIITCVDTKSPLHNVKVPAASFSCGPDGSCSVTVGGDVFVSMPACPKIPPQECCVDMVNMVVLCKDETIAPHGAAVVEVFQIFDDGYVSLSYRGQDGVVRNGRFKMCEEPPDCCYDAKTGTLVCNTRDRRSYAYHGMKVEVREIAGDVVYCKSPETSTERAWCFRLPLCPEKPPFDCCYDALTSTLVCQPLPDGSPSPYNGISVELIGMEGKDAIVRHPSLNDGNRTLVPLCPEKPPISCCYDVAKGTLRCTGDATWDGKEVSLVDMKMAENGDIFAIVQHPDLPGGMYTFPVCDDETPDDCCYDTATRTLICKDSELDGRSAGIVVRFEGPDGRTWVWATWRGGGGRIPLCPECPPEKCPPSFCCVNVETNTFVCPQDSALSGAPAPVADVITDDAGNKWAKLQDGTLVPTCGRQCPPPILCPTCPPGQWLSPDGVCTDGPECPPDRRRPPGVLIPECPWWAKQGHCCEDCALGQDCVGDDACPTPVAGETAAQTAARARTRNPDGVLTALRGGQAQCTQGEWECYQNKGQWNCYCSKTNTWITVPVDPNSSSTPPSIAVLRAARARTGTSPSARSRKRALQIVAQRTRTRVSDWTCKKGLDTWVCTHKFKSLVDEIPIDPVKGPP